MVETIGLLVFTGESNHSRRFQGFLGGAGFRPSTVCSLDGWFKRESISLLDFLNYYFSRGLKPMEVTVLPQFPAKFEVTFKQAETLVKSP